MPRKAQPARQREFTDAFIESEFYKRFMASGRERRQALIRALQAADTLAVEGLDAKPAAAPLFDAASQEPVAQ